MWCMETSTITIEITRGDCDLLVESLGYTKRAFLNYTDYPTHESKRKQVDRVDKLITKIRQARKRLTATG